MLFFVLFCKWRSPLALIRFIWELAIAHRKERRRKRRETLQDLGKNYKTSERWVKISIQLYEKKKCPKWCWLSSEMDKKKKKKIDGNNCKLVKIESNHSLCQLQENSVLWWKFILEAWSRLMIRRSSSGQRWGAQEQTQCKYRMFTSQMLGTWGVPTLYRITSMWETRKASWVPINICISK